MSGPLAHSPRAAAAASRLAPAGSRLPRGRRVPGSGHPHPRPHPARCHPLPARGRTRTGHFTDTGPAGGDPCVCVWPCAPRVRGPSTPLSFSGLPSTPRLRDTSLRCLGPANASPARVPAAGPCPHCKLHGACAAGPPVPPLWARGPGRGRLGRAHAVLSGVAGASDRGSEGRLCRARRCALRPPPAGRLVARPARAPPSSRGFTAALCSRRPPA